MTWQAVPELSLFAVPLSYLRARLTERDSLSGVPRVSNWTKCARSSKDIEKRFYVCTEVLPQLECANRPSRNHCQISVPARASSDRPIVGEIHASCEISGLEDPAAPHCVRARTRATSRLG